MVHCFHHLHVGITVYESFLGAFTQVQKTLLIHRCRTWSLCTLLLLFIFQIQMSGEKLDIVGSVVDSANVQDCGSVYRRNHYTTASPCDRNPCLNGGTCRLIDSIGHYNCTCQEGFRWEQCRLISVATDIVVSGMKHLSLSKSWSAYTGNQCI